MVQRHRARVELGRDAAHRHRVEAFAIGDARRGGDDLVAREARPAGRGLDARPHVERAEVGREPVERLRLQRGFLGGFVGVLGRVRGAALDLLGDLFGDLLDDELRVVTDVVAGVFVESGVRSPLPAILVCHPYSVLLT